MRIIKLSVDGKIEFATHYGRMTLVCLFHD